MKTRITELLNIDYPIFQEEWPGLRMVTWLVQYQSWWSRDHRWWECT